MAQLANSTKETFQDALIALDEAHDRRQTLEHLLEKDFPWDETIITILMYSQAMENKDFKKGISNGWIFN